MTLRPLASTARSGNSGMRMTIRSNMGNRRLPFEQVDLVHVGGDLAAEHDDDDRQPHGGFPGRDGDHEQGHDLARERVQVVGERHEVEVGPVQHDLDAHEHDDEVPPDEHSDEPRHEQDRADRYIRPDGYHRYSLTVKRNHKETATSCPGFREPFNE